jgi:hypothetical protein
VRFLAILFGLVALLLVPAAVAAAVVLSAVDVLPALEVTVPAAFLCGLVGVAGARRARFRVDRSVYRAGDRSVRFARFVVWAGLYVSLVGAVALAFYGLLRARS